MHWSEQRYQAVFQPGAPDRVLWVVEDGGSIRGFLVARFTSAECELENLVVAVADRRRGFGLQLVQSLIAAASQRNIERILLEARESNVAACALYEKVGFQLNGRRKAYYSHPEGDALLFALTCTASGADKR
ncbi:MAG: ribosomal protein S18P -alanine acetyltransferase [Acidobacteriaceae bacterium]|nr:ribosomal protein S18P -alanine acetyltransferase [Acidobacteriaceae bacterium]